MASVGIKKARRFFMDIQDINSRDGFEVTAYDEQCRWLKVQFNGVEGTAYDGGTFNLKIELKSDFPFSAPNVYFENGMFHPNLGASGKVCMSILDNWKAGTKIYLVAEGCRALLDDGNSKSPLNGTAAYMMERHPMLYRNTSIYWTAVFANGPTRPHQLHMQVLEALQFSSLRNEERALKVLTNNMWNVE